LSRNLANSLTEAKRFVTPLWKLVRPRKIALAQITYTKGN